MVRYPNVPERYGGDVHNGVHLYSKKNKMTTCGLPYTMESSSDDNLPRERDRNPPRPVQFGAIVAFALGLYTILSGVLTSLNSYLSYRVLVLGMMGAAALPVVVFLWRCRAGDTADGYGSSVSSPAEAEITLLFIGGVIAYVLTSFGFPDILTTEITRILVLSAAFLCLLSYFAIHKVVRRTKMTLMVSAGLARSERIAHRFFTSLGIFLLFPFYIVTILYFPSLRGRLETIIVFCGLTAACLIGFWSVSRDVMELANLLGRASKVAEGKENELLDVPREGELAELANSFNVILAERDETIEKLEEAKERIEKLAGRVRQQAVIDGLTGAYNRRYFQMQFKREMERAERNGQNLGLGMIDVDKFKDFNDTHGHPAGDRMLKKLAELIQENIRDSDTVCRYGGDEFTVILPETGEGPMNRKNGRKILQRVKKAVENHEFEGGQGLSGPIRDHITISAGLAMFPHDARDAEEVVIHADRMLYRAKEEGRNRLRDREG